MAYLGMDIAQAPSLVMALHRTAGEIGSVQQLVVAAQLQADLPTNVALILDDVEGSLRRAAALTTRAATVLDGYRLTISDWAQPVTAIAAAVHRLAHAYNSVKPAGDDAAATWPEPTRTPTPVGPDPEPLPPAQAEPSPVGVWSDARPFASWDQVHQAASHNSYAVPGGVTSLAEHGVRVFELDIHRGAPTSFMPSGASDGPLAPLWPIVRDHLDHAGGRDEDWRVYHFSGDTASEYEFLSHGLAEVAALDSLEPVTVFIDNKDAFDGPHTEALLSHIVDNAFGDRLFGPADVMATAPGARTLQQAVQHAGWPAAIELKGRVMVVVTDHIEIEDRNQSSVFVAPEPVFEQGSAGPVHIAEPNAIFYNVHARSITDQEIAVVSRTGNLLRTFGNGRCDWLAVSPGAYALPHFLATDIDPGSGESCPPAVPYPVEGVPVPTPNAD